MKKYSKILGNPDRFVFLENILKRSESTQVSCGRPQKKKGYSNEYPSFGVWNWCWYLYAACAYVNAVRNKF